MMDELSATQGATPRPGDAPRAGRALARALWYVAPGRVDLWEESVAPLAPGEARVRTLWSGVSRGTERLVLSGRVPPSEHARMRAPAQQGAFPFPVKYGYAAVGVVEEGPDDLAGRTVFALVPHADVFTASAAALVPVPDVVPPRRAVLAANMETALNAVWDGAVGPGDRVAVVGAGLVGCLVASLCARVAGTEVTLVDVRPERAAVAAALGCRFAVPGEVPTDCDVVFHASATPAGLATAIAAAGFEASIVELSWYGEGTVAAPLGGAFHAQRLRLASSQVGSVSPSRRPRWSHRRRLEKALALLDDARLDTLIDHEVAFEDLPARLPGLLSAERDALGVAVRYPV
jgi:NADPH:quinone reductase-like Zn-dependent oxidoreductase